MDPGVDGPPSTAPQPPTPGWGASAPAHVEPEQLQFREADPKTLAELVTRARRGDEQALNDLMRLCLPRVYALVRSLAHGRDEGWIQDAVAEAMFEIYRTIGRLRNAYAFKRWQYRLTVTACVSKAHREAGRKAREVTLTAHEGEESADPVQMAEENGFREYLHRQIQQLPEDYRQVLLLRYVAGYTDTETARALGIPKGTVRSRTHEALRRLRRAIPDNLWEDPDGPKPTASS